MYITDMVNKKHADPEDESLFDFELDLDGDRFGQVVCPSCKKAPVLGAVMRNKKTVFRRAFGESKLAELLPLNFETGFAYHVLSGGDIDSLSFLKHVIKQQNLEYCLFSTWCMAQDDVQQFKTWIDTKKIIRLDGYVGEIFPNSYCDEFEALKPVISSTGGRVCVFRNHSKIYAGMGDKFPFLIESSANINTNPRTENTVITINMDLFSEYKAYFDGIKSFNRDFDDWKPYKSKNVL